MELKVAQPWEGGNDHDKKEPGKKKRVGNGGTYGLAGGPEEEGVEERLRSQRQWKRIPRKETGARHWCQLGP